MLKIHFGALQGELKMPSGFFDLEYEDDWFGDPFVKQMILDVDKSEAVSAYNIISPVLGGITHKQSSGGVKNLILAYKREDLIIDASHCGDNCSKWLIEIGKIKDLVITLHHPMLFDRDFDALILNNNKVIHTFKEYGFEALKFLCK